jgi:hypothetical protein
MLQRSSILTSNVTRILTTAVCFIYLGDLLHINVSMLRDLQTPSFTNHANGITTAQHHSHIAKRALHAHISHHHSHIVKRTLHERIKIQSIRRIWPAHPPFRAAPFRRTGACCAGDTMFAFDNAKRNLHMPASRYRAMTQAIL